MSRAAQKIVVVVTDDVGTLTRRRVVKVPRHREAMEIAGANVPLGQAIGTFLLNRELIIELANARILWKVLRPNPTQFVGVARKQQRALSDCLDREYAHSINRRRSQSGAQTPVLTLCAHWQPSRDTLAQPF